MSDPSVFNVVGERPTQSDTALLIIDMINAMDFEGGEALCEQTRGIIEPLVKLKRRARSANVPVIYVNDNFGRWQSNFQQTLSEVCERECLGRQYAEALRPDEEDYFVLKPKHSGFLYTPLPLLLQGLNVDRLIMTGVAGNICVQFTANDALMHGYDVRVPRDTVASETRDANDAMLRQLTSVFGVDTRPSNEIRFETRSDAA